MRSPDFIVSHSAVEDLYIKSYLKLFPNISVLYKNKIHALKLLFSNPFKVVVVENIHTFWWIFILRFDFKIIHIPRGGGTFKVGWKSSFSNFNLFKKILIYIKLKRRNKIIVSSIFFKNYLAEQEFTKKSNILIYLEPILSVKHKIKRNFSSPKCLIALSECMKEEDYLALYKILKNKGLNMIDFSFHPLTKTNLNLTSARFYDYDIIFTDCTTLANYTSFFNQKLFIIKDKQTFERRMIKKQDFFFENIYENDINLEKPSFLKIKLTKNKITDYFISA